MTAVAFALTAGEPSDVRDLLHVDPFPAGGRHLLACVEPLEPSTRGFEVAALALKALHETFAAGAALPPAAALVAAFVAANATVLDENRPSAGCRWERRVHVGAAAIAVAGNDLTVAQVPATQVLIVQERQLYAFPELASWCPRYVPTSDRPEPDPLGYGEVVRPALFRTRTAPGDLLVLCSSAVARHLARDADLAVRWQSEALLLGDLDGTLDELGRVIAAHGLDDAHAGGIVLGGSAGLDRGIEALRHGRDRLRTACSAGTPRTTASASRRRPRVDAPLTRRGLPRGSDAVGIAGRSNWSGLGVAIDPAPTPPTSTVVAGGSTPDSTWPGPTVRLAPGPAPKQRPVAIAGGAAFEPGRQPGGPVPGVRLRLAGLSRRVLPRSRPPGVRLGAHRRAIGAPGAGSVRRYRRRTAGPAGWRGNLPRGPEVRVPRRLLTAVVVGVLALGGSAFAVDRHRDRINRAEAAIAAVDFHLGAADQAVDAENAIARTQAALDEARRSGAAPGTIDARQRDLDAARDLAAGTGRLVELTRLGRLPESLRNRSVRLVRTGREVFLVGGGLYQLDADDRRLVRLLAPGTQLDGGIVGELHDAVADGGGVVATDGAALYARDAAGRWTRRPLGHETGAAAWPPMPSAAFDGGFYAFDRPGRILHFPAATVGAPPRTWAEVGQLAEPAGVRDLAIDGRVHLLLDDGRVLSFYRGKLEATLAPVLSPPLADPVALYAETDANFLYLADAGTEQGTTAGRIVRLDGEGRAWALLPPEAGGEDGVAREAAVALGDVRDLVVDESAGALYFLTEDALWGAKLPSPPGVLT